MTTCTTYITTRSGWTRHLCDDSACGAAREGCVLIPTGELGRSGRPPKRDHVVPVVVRYTEPLCPLRPTVPTLSRSTWCARGTAWDGSRLKPGASRDLPSSLGDTRLRSKPQPWFQIRNRTLLLADLVLIVTSVLASFALRLDLGPVFVAYLPAASVMIALALLVKPVVYHVFGLYRRYWVYASIREMLTVVLATATASAIVTVCIMVTILLGGLRGFPRSVLAIDFLLSVISVGGLRLSVRLLAESGQISQKADGLAGKRRVVIVGAGDAGVLVVREMQRNPQLHILPVAFVDDDPQKQKASIHGVRVAGTLRDLASVVDRSFAQEVVIAIPSAPGDVLRQVTTICLQRGIPYRTMPGIYELIGGKVSVSRLREVDISDLLRREPARLDDQAVGATLAGRRVLVTGAGGSIGLELCRQIGRWEPASLAMLGHGENSIFESLLELRETNPDLPVIPMIADVRDP